MGGAWGNRGDRGGPSAVPRGRWRSPAGARCRRARLRGAGRGLRPQLAACPGTELPRDAVTHYLMYRTNEPR